MCGSSNSNPKTAKNRSSISDSADAWNGCARVYGFWGLANCLFQGNLCLNYSNKYTVSAKRKKMGFVRRKLTRAGRGKTAQNVSITWRYYCESHLNIARRSPIVPHPSIHGMMLLTQKPMGSATTKIKV